MLDQNLQILILITKIEIHEKRLIYVAKLTKNARHKYQQKLINI